MIRGDINQVGDDTAFSVRVQISHGILSISEQFVQVDDTYFVPISDPGARYPFTLSLPANDWRDAVIKIKWQIRPVRQKKTVVNSISLSDLNEIRVAPTEHEANQKRQHEFDEHVRRLERT